MKKLSIILSFLLGLSSAFTQTNVYTEDFEGTLSVSSYNASGTGANWSIGSNYSVSGTQSDSAIVLLNDTVYLETNAFSTLTYPFVTLAFNQICKIDFFDGGVVQVSIDNGVTWTDLGANEYTGNGFLNAGKFSSISYNNWQPGSGSAIPQSSWWEGESFDISAIAGNESQVKIRFGLIDIDGNGARGNYGWILDDLNVVGAGCELNPPSITLTGSIMQGAIYSTGPYLIEADIIDTSGIASATLTYTVNGGSPSMLNMTNSSGNTYQATIPSASIGDTICYSITAVDATTCSNQSTYPISGCVEFDIKANPPATCIGNPVFGYPYVEEFAGFTSGNGTNSVGTLINNWENDGTNDTHDWWVYNQATNSGGTGPSADHSLSDANYMYVESSGQFSNTTAILNTPCYDFTNLLAPKFSFWYHMFGQNMGELHVDAYFGGAWVMDIMPAIIGDQGDQWFFREIDLTSYAGNIVKLRFRAIVGAGFRSDIAIDDIEINEPVTNDIFLSDIISPFPTGCSGSANEFVTVELSNVGALGQNSIPLAYRVNGGNIIRDTANFLIPTGTSANHTFQQTVNMSTTGSYAFDIWTELANDGNLNNDSILGYTVASSSITNVFPDNNDFDNFVPGIPGTFLEGWVNDVSDAYDWYVHTGATPSNGTGPAGDHTSGNGNFIYMEATNANNLEASIYSKCINIANLNVPELIYSYHMSGGAMGDLNIDISINGFVVQGIIPTISGDQGPNWNTDTIDLSPYKGVVKIIFRGLTGNGFQSDIAIDDVMIRDAQPVGLNENDQFEKDLVHVYPNPAKDQVNFRASEKINKIRLLNLIGQVATEISPNQKTGRLSLSGLNSGVYFLEVRLQSGDLIIEKLIVQ